MREFYAWLIVLLLPAAGLCQWPAPAQRAPLELGAPLRIQPFEPQRESRPAYPEPAARERSSDSGGFSVTGPRGSSSCSWVRYGSTAQLVCQ